MNILQSGDASQQNFYYHSQVQSYAAASDGAPSMLQLKN